MTINKVHELEQAVVKILNLDGWQLEWSGDGYEHYDAKGLTPKGKPCVMEMKFRKKYYETKMLEKLKYDKLMSMDQDIVKLYFVNDPKANYMFWLNDIELTETKELYCPYTTLWSKKKINKIVYLLKEEQAAIINSNER